MQRSVSGFEAAYRRHLAVHQRRLVLDALGRALPPTATVGEIVDAAAMLGFPEIGELSLADLADALLVPSAGTTSGGSAADDVASHDEDEDEDEDEDDVDAIDDEDDVEADDGEEEPEVAAAPAARGRGKAKPAAAKPSKAAAKPASKPAPAAAPKPAAKGKPGKAPKVSLDERMSPEEAAAALLPLVALLGEATMQQLEESTAGGGRRKLRFHIGQLVKHGRLARHGMGRGTYYTVT